MIHLSIVTPERKLIDEKVDQVMLPGSEGYFGVLEGHAPMLSALKVGQIEFRKDNRVEYLAVAWGFAEVLSDRVSVLADIAERATEIDLERARRARERAEKLLAQGGPDVNWERARGALEKAIVRIEIAERNR